MPSASAPPVDAWKLAIIRGYLWLAAIGSAGTAVVPFFATSDPTLVLPVVLALVGATVVYVVMLVAAYRAPWTWRFLGLAVAGAVLLAASGIMLLLPTRQVSVAATFVIIPLIAGFLGHRRFVFPAWLVAALTLLGLSWAAPTGVDSATDAFAVVIVGCMVAGLVWIVERERERWQARAREHATALERAVVEAEQAASARTRFLATMSHEIRTPMNGVLGLTQVLLDSGLDAEQLELARTVHDSGRVLHHVLNDILDLSRLESGQVAVDPRPTDLRDVVRRVQRLNQARADARGLQLLTEVQDDVPDLGLIDDARLSQILNNLVSNALKFTHEGSVTLRVQPDDDQVLFEVIDSGIGLDGVDVQALFQPFVQADASTQRCYGGTGLGLAICSSLAELMGGSIGARDHGDGALFWVRLPMEPVEHSVGQQEAQEQDLTGLRVLVAEDNAVNQLVVERVLEGLGASVSLVEDGGGAVHAVVEQDWDVVLMDCHMHQVDGFEATRRIRSLGPRGALPILALTASVTLEDREHALAAGMDEVISKPIDRAALLAALLRWTAPGQERDTCSPSAPPATAP